jgi:hypothetical protein
LWVTKGSMDAWLEANGTPSFENKWLVKIYMLLIMMHDCFKGFLKLKSVAR